jgi:hypothetical protein
MSPTALQHGPVFLAEAAQGMYVTIPQLIAVALIVGGILMLLRAVRRGVAGPAHLRAPKQPPAEAAPLKEYMADARELADLLADRLDRQAHRIERLIAEADERIRRLERLSGDSVRMGVAPRPGSDPVNQQVYDLADEGLPPVEIARKLHQHTGKVELILALRRKSAV